jgi:hypothetical protein
MSATIKILAHFTIILALGVLNIIHAILTKVNIASLSKWSWSAVQANIPSAFPLSSTSIAEH